MEPATTKDLVSLRNEIAARFATKEEVNDVRNTAGKALLSLAEVKVQLETISASLTRMDGHLTWFVRIIVAAVLAALLSLVLR